MAAARIAGIQPNAIPITQPAETAAPIQTPK
jgi:hypothetical protein